MNLLPLGTLVLAAIFGSNALAQSKTLQIGQVAALTGPASSIGLPVTQGAHSYINMVNAKGGVNGYQLELLDRDDGFKPERTLQEVKTLFEKESPIALLNIIGAPNNGDLVTSGLLEKYQVSVVGAFTGATSVRSLKSPYLYFIRASVADESIKIVDQLNSIGLTRIALLYADDAFGTDAKTHMEQALAKKTRKLVAAASYAPASVEILPAVKIMLQSNAQAVAMFGTGAAVSKFVVEYRKSGGGAMLVANSSTSADALIKAIGAEAARGVGLNQVVPSLTRSNMHVVKEYLEALTKFGDPTWKPSSYGLEGFMAAKILVEAIHRTPSPITRVNLSKSLSKIGQVDLGGFTLDYRDPKREGSSLVDIGIMGSNGRLMN